HENRHRVRGTGLSQPAKAWLRRAAPCASSLCSAMVTPIRMLLAIDHWVSPWAIAISAIFSATSRASDHSLPDPRPCPLSLCQLRSVQQIERMKFRTRVLEQALNKAQPFDVL